MVLWSAHWPLNYDDLSSISRWSLQFLLFILWNCLKIRTKINDKEAGERGHFVQKVDLFFKRLVPCLTSDVKILLQILFRFLLSRKEKNVKKESNKNVAQQCRSRDTDASFNENSKLSVRCLIRLVTSFSLFTAYFYSHKRYIGWYVTINKRSKGGGIIILLAVRQ